MESYVNIHFTLPGRSYQELVLLTGGFLILGKNSSYYSAKNVNIFSFYPIDYTLNWTSGTFAENVTTLTTAKNTYESGIYTFGTTNGIITNRLKLAQKAYGTNKTDLCNFVPLGYRYCFFTSITDNSTSTNSYVITPGNTP